MTALHADVENRADRRRSLKDQTAQRLFDFAQRVEVENQGINPAFGLKRDFAFHGVSHSDHP